MIQVIILAVLGAIVGSFIMASVWRLRASQLATEKSKSNQAKLLVKKQKLASVKIKDDYSRCFSCSHRLAWNDLIPIYSWLRLKGKCRYCHKPIGWLEFLAEVIMAILFGLSYYLLASFLPIGLLMLWFGFLIILAILFIYDYKWMVMPSSILFLSIIWAGLFALVNLAQNQFSLILISEYVLSIIILAGIYAALWAISKGQWVGSGDIYLGVALALLLADWRLAFVSLFSANLIGVIIVLPSLVKVKTKTNSKVPLGPLLIVGFLLTFLAQAIIKNYLYYLY